MRSRLKTYISWFVSLVLAGVSVCAGEPREVSFIRDIQPILSARCLGCHGAGHAEGGLNLISRESATGTLDSGKHAIVPEKPDLSEMIRRVGSADSSERMPPKGPSLTNKQISLIRRWIERGAVWPQHWSYSPLPNVSTRPDWDRPEWQIGLRRDRSQSTPAPGEPHFVTSYRDWCHSPIDEYIAAKLADEKMAPTAAAEPRILLRRIYFDLTGLPPTPEQVEAFLSDRSPAAYERLTDQLLASPRFGERFARIWMDLVHFAETHGHDQDRPREHAWPYRNYLIRAFNQDTPYSRFISEQIAGDVLFPDDPWAIRATGFLATGPWDESSLRDIREDTIDREIARYIDRDDIVTTVMSTFTSSTVHCARCHDHKFDPITQAEYYGLQAVFASTDKANRAYDADPLVARRRLELVETQKQLLSRGDAMDPTLLTADVQRRVSDWERSVGQSANRWQVLKPQEYTAQKATLDRLPDNSVLSTGVRDDKDTYTITAQAQLPLITGIRLELLTDPSLPLKGPGRQDNGNLHINEFLVVCKSASTKDLLPIVLQNAKADFDQQGWTSAMAIDGKPDTAWGVHPQIGQPHQATFELRDPLLAADGAVLRFDLQQTHGRGHLIGRLRLSVTDSPLPLPPQADTLPETIATILRSAPDERSDAQRVTLAAYVVGQDLSQEIAKLPQPLLVYSGTNRYVPDGSFRPSPQPRSVHILARGDVTKPMSEAVPGALSIIPAPFAVSDVADEGARRAGLASWLQHPRNVLTWRSIANRLWQQHFDQGLVESSSDFGYMGSTPTHPELLDWLATDLISGQGNSAVHATDDGPSERGSLKRLHRNIVLSATYRQSSQYNSDFAARDADNRWLWRSNRRRLDAESIRDSILSLAGILDFQMDGASVRQFIQTPGIHVTPNVDYLNFDVNAPANRRRSVYRFVFRTLPDPFMDALDCPDASQLTPKRTSSVTALQALALLNDKSLLHGCQVLSQRLERENGTVVDQVAAAYLIIFGREAEPQEKMLAIRFVERHSLASFCRLLTNTNEFIFVD